MLKRRHAVISGGGQGFGQVLALTFLRDDFDVTICGRNQQSLDESCAFLRVRYLEDRTSDSPLAKIVGTVCDISKIDHVSRFCAELLEQNEGVDVLLNNASIIGPIGEFDVVDSLKWIETIQVNLFGTMLMSQALMPHFKQKRQGHVINISGGGATSSRPRFSAYAASKAAVVRFTETIADEMKPYGVSINAVAPGVMATAMLESVATAGRDLVGVHEYEQYQKAKENGVDSLVNAAKLCLYLANLTGNAITGKLISATWDDWRNLEEHQEVLASSDIYTLRRITPADRNIIWENK